MCFVDTRWRHPSSRLTSVEAQEQLFQRTYDTTKIYSMHITPLSDSSSSMRHIQATSSASLSILRTNGSWMYECLTRARQDFPLCYPYLPRLRFPSLVSLLQETLSRASSIFVPCRNQSDPTERHHESILLKQLESLRSYHRALRTQCALSSISNKATTACATLRPRSLDYARQHVSHPYHPNLLVHD